MKTGWFLDRRLSISINPLPKLVKGLEIDGMGLQFNKFFFAALALFLCLIYWPVLREHPTLQFDDQDLVLALKPVSSLQDYTQAFKDRRILDLQPIRDFSYWIELQVEDATGWRNSQAVNLFLWFLILLLVSWILKKTARQSTLNPYLILLLAAHPLATTTVAWTSSRKHLLSALFLMVCTALTLRRDERKSGKGDVGIALAFLFSVLSQPISLAWPLWWACRQGIRQLPKSKKDLLLAATLSLISMTVLVLNYRYYTGDFFLKSPPDSPPKINEESLRNLISRFLVLGRYTYQIFIPLQPVGLPYKIFHWPGYAGLALLVGLLFSQWKWKILKSSEWILFLFLPIAVVTVKLTHHGGYDTYIFVTLIGLVIALGVSWSRQVLSGSARLGLLILTLIFASLSHSQAGRWTSDIGIFSQAYESEKTLMAATGFAKLLLDEKSLERASEVIEDIERRDPENRELPNLKGRYLFLLDLPSDKKAALFAEHEINQPWYQYYYAAFQATVGDAEPAFERILKSWQSDPQKFKVAFAGQENILFSNWKKICEMAAKTDCYQLQIIEKSFRDF